MNFFKTVSPESAGICDGAMQSWDRVFMYKDRLIRVDPHWIRDYVLTAKGFRYTEADLTSLPDLFLENQHESGFFYEIVAPEKDFHSGMRPSCNGAYIVEPPYRKAEPVCNYGLVRLELEADIEYLMVEGCYIIWQATGDDQWLEQQLPRLEKGLQYIQTSTIRWSKEYDLAKRAHTLDTWDFTNRLSSAHDRMIHPEDPMGIFHGDNTGLYYAMTLMAKMIRYFLFLYDLERNPLDLAKARALGDSITRIQCPDGRIPTWLNPDRPTANDWINCMFATANALKMLAEKDGEGEN